MRNVRLTSALAAALAMAFILSANAASARTWRVEKDGSGDFTVIQDAVDVAASGDTVRIGVGRFDDKRYYTCPGWSDSVRVLVPQHDLTIIGSGNGTVIGQVEPWELSQGDHKGVVGSDYWGNGVIRVQSMHFENMGTGIYTSYENYEASQVQIRDCSFADHQHALSIISIDVGGEATIENCVFDRMARNGAQIHFWNLDKLTIRRCVSTLPHNPSWSNSHFGAVGVEEILIVDSEFIGGHGGADFTFGGTAVIRGCRFEGQYAFAVVPSMGADVAVEDCLFENQEQALESIRTNNRLSVRNCQILNVGDCAFRLTNVGEFAAHHNDIDHGARGAVLIDDITNCETPRTLDFTNNYWFTDNPDSIAAWVRDRNDSDEACYYVNFDPFSDESTPVSSRRLSDVKSLFR